MKIAVTGASGRIGNLLVRRLTEAGHMVRVLVHRETRGLRDLPVETIHGSILNPHDLDRLIQDSEVVFHLAAVVSIRSGMSEKLRRVNIEGARYVLESALLHGVRRVVSFSTVHAFHEGTPDTVFDESRPLALDAEMAYSRTKAEALQMTLQFARDKNLEVLALCPTAVLGPYDYEPSLSGKMLIDFYKQRIPVLAPGGFDWVDVRDVTDAAIAALHKGRSGEAYLLSGHYATVRDMAALCSAATGKSAPGWVMPYPLLRLGAPFVEGLSLLTNTRPFYTRDAINTLKNGSKFVSSEKARRELGYHSRPLEETIADAYDWFAKQNYL